MLMIWQVGEARKKLDEVINRALTDGPQRIHHRGQVVVVISDVDYQEMTGEHESLTAYLLRGPDLSELDLARDPAPMRNVV
jgi:antitoxin Phd